MASYTQELVGCPEIELLESPASWLCRLALSQGATLREMKKYLQLPRGHDFDLMFTRLSTRKLAMVCGLNREPMTLVYMMMSRLRRIDLHGRTHLLFEQKSPLYRFCPQCLYEQRTKHFPLHWRFKAWRCCWQHKCLLSEGCPHCLAPVKLPTDMLMAGPRRKGIASLDFCLVCGESLTHGRQEATGTLRDELLAPFELTLLRNGRALLAALFSGEVWFSDLKVKLGKASIRRIEKKGLLPLEHFRLDDFEMRRRYRYSLERSDERQESPPSISSAGPVLQITAQ